MWLFDLLACFACSIAGLLCLLACSLARLLACSLACLLACSLACLLAPSLTTQSLTESLRKSNGRIPHRIRHRLPSTIHHRILPTILDRTIHRIPQSPGQESRQAGRQEGGQAGTQARRHAGGQPRPPTQLDESININTFIDVCEPGEYLKKRLQKIGATFDPQKWAEKFVYPMWVHKCFGLDLGAVFDPSFLGSLGFFALLFVYIF